MAAPNRKAEVAAIAAKYPQSFGGDDETIDARRRLLMPIIARELNKIEGREVWFLMNRMDRQDEDPKPGRLTADVIVWIDTLEHVDVLSASGSMWDNLGVIPANKQGVWLRESWKLWPSWDTLAPPPPPPPDLPDPPPPTGDHEARIAALEAALARVKAAL